MKYSVCAGIGDRHVLARTRTDRIVSSEGKRRTSAGAFASIRKTRVTSSPATPLQNPSAKCEALCIRSIAAALGVFTPFFLRSNGIVRPQQTLSIQMPQRSGIWGPIIPGRHAPANIAKLGSRCSVFQKNDLTTFFANVTCAAIGDRIVSVQRRGGSLGGSIRLTIFHSSFPSFSVSTCSAIRIVWRAYAGEQAVEGADY